MVFASNNKGKLREIRAILGEDIKSLKDVNVDVDVLEDGETFYDNAKKKAYEIYNIVKEPVIEKVNKGFILFAKKFEADIVPVGICGFDGYAKKLFEKHMTLKIGTPIPYTLDEDEIVKEWARQICEFTGFENQVEQPVEETVSC